MESNNPIKDVRLSFVCDKNFDAMTPCGTGRHCEAKNTKLYSSFDKSRRSSGLLNAWCIRIAAIGALVVGLGMLNNLDAKEAIHKKQLMKVRKKPALAFMWYNVVDPEPTLKDLAERQVWRFLDVDLSFLPKRLDSVHKVDCRLRSMAKLPKMIPSQDLELEISQDLLLLLISLNAAPIEKEEDFDPNKRYAYQLNIDNGRIVA